jgi:hypothetical protein
MYIVTIEEGTFTIPGIGAATNNIGVISKEDVLSAKRNQFINYEDTQEINGGNFMSGLKKFGHNVGKFVHDAAPYVKAAIPYVREGISLAKDLAPLLAAGEVVGEGRMNRCDLKHRIRRI